MGISEKWESRKYGNIWEYAHGMQGMWECIEIINLPGDWNMGIAEIWEYMTRSTIRVRLSFHMKFMQNQQI